MSTYQELKGLKVKYLSADTSGDRTQEGELFYNSTDFKLKSFVATAAWSSSGSVITARFNSGIGGTQTAAFLAGGATPDDTATDDTYEYNGSGWTIGGDMAGTDRLTTGSGTLTAGLIAGGNPGDHALFLFAFTIFLLSLGGVRPTVTSIIIICTNIDIKHIHLNI